LDNKVFDIIDARCNHEDHFGCSMWTKHLEFIKTFRKSIQYTEK